MKRTALKDGDNIRVMGSRRFLNANFFGFLVYGYLSVTGAFFASAADKASPVPNEPWVAPARAARKQNPVAADGSVIAEGKQLFTIGCLPCHGIQGKGDGPASSTLERNGTPVRPGNLSDPTLWEQTDGTIFWKLSEGRSPMPAFQETFTEEQRWKIVNYVRTLAPKRTGDKP